MWYNQFKTVILLSGLSGILMALGGFIGGFAGVTAALVLSLVINFFSYFYSDKMILNMYNAQILDTNRYSWVYQIIQELTSRANIPMPKVYMINTPMANAFATGRNPSHASVAVTNGILDLLTPEELRAVLSHEISHVTNRDILISSVAATLATAITYIANTMRYINLINDNNPNNNRRNPLAMLFLVIVMPIAASLIQLAISRSREFMADESGAELCEDPLALASALKKITGSVEMHPLNSQDLRADTTAHIFIVKPFNAVEGISALFSTHPPIRERVLRLEQMYKSMR